MSRAEIDAANQALMEGVAAGDTSAIAALYHDDAILSASGTDLFRGPEAIANFFKGAIDQGVTSAKLTTISLEELGETAIEDGAYELYAGDKLVDSGSFLVVWKQQSGNWLLYRDFISPGTSS
ncbi:MAG: nuclear transport factor 2 family protein [Pseudomonadota bacterium]